MAGVPDTDEMEVLKYPDHLQFSEDCSCRFSYKLHTDSRAQKEQFYCCTSVLSDFRTICINDHTFLANIIAGGDQSVLSFQLYHTHATGAYFIDAFEITKTRNLNTNGSGSFHNCGILFY